MQGTKVNKKQVEAVFGRVQKLSKALQANYPPTTTLQVEGHETLTPVISTSLDGQYELQAKVDAAKTALTKAVTDRDAGYENAKAYLENVVAAVVANKGVKSSELAAFGITVPKPRRPLTSEQRVLAAAKRAATKKVRGTLSRKQREAIQVGGQPGLVAVTPGGAQVPIRPNVPARGDGGLVPTAPEPSSPESAGGATASSASVQAPATTGNGASSSGTGSH